MIGPGRNAATVASSEAPVGKAIRSGGGCVTVTVGADPAADGGAIGAVGGGTVLMTGS